MKGLIIVSALLFGFDLFAMPNGFLRENEMKPPLVPQKRERIPFFLVKVYSCPRVEFMKFPTEHKLCVNGRMLRFLTVSEGNSLNGIIMRSDLTLFPTMNDIMFARNILKAFGNVVCTYSVGSVSQRFFQNSL